MEKHSDMMVVAYHQDKKYGNILQFLNDSTFNFPEKLSPSSVVKETDKPTSDPYPPQSSPPPLPISKFTKFKFQNPYDFDFELEKGKECISMQSLNSTAVPVFLGYCYFCDCPKHSQNYCPLRFCQFCSLYGHSARVCPKNSAHGNDNWRRSTKHSSNPFKFWKKTHKYNNTKIPFGSTWKHNKPNVSNLQDWRKRADHIKMIQFDFNTEESSPSSSSMLYGVLLDTE
jgi:hypothetical protein